MSSNKFNPFIKLSKGILMFGSVSVLDSYIGGTDGLNKMKKAIQLFLDFFPYGLGNFIACIFSLVISLTMIYFYISGMYRICTFNMYLPIFENKD
jgi:hypothetical protein